MTAKATCFGWHACRCVQRRPRVSAQPLAWGCWYWVVNATGGVSKQHNIYPCRTITRSLFYSSARQPERSLGSRHAQFSATLTESA